MAERAQRVSLTAGRAGRRTGRKAQYCRSLSVMCELPVVRNGRNLDLGPGPGRAPISTQRMRVGDLPLSELLCPAAFAGGSGYDPRPGSGDSPPAFRGTMAGPRVPPWISACREFTLSPLLAVSRCGSYSTSPPAGGVYAELEEIVRFRQGNGTPKAAVAPRTSTANITPRQRGSFPNRSFGFRCPIPRARPRGRAVQPGARGLR